MKQQAFCVVQSPTSEEEPGVNGNAFGHHSVDVATAEEPAVRCATPTATHRQSRRRRQLSNDTMINGSKSSVRNLAPPASSSAPVKSHYKVIHFSLYRSIFVCFYV